MQLYIRSTGISSKLCMNCIKQLWTIYFNITLIWWNSALIIVKPSYLRRKALSTPLFYGTPRGYQMGRRDLEGFPAVLWWCSGTWSVIVMKRLETFLQQQHVLRKPSTRPDVLTQPLLSQQHNLQHVGYIIVNDYDDNDESAFITHFTIDWIKVL